MASALDNPWKIILTAMDGTIYGELTNAKERTVSDPHMSTPSLSCTIRLDHELAVTVLNEETLIKAYRGTLLIFHGPVITVEEVGQNQASSVRLTAAGAWWRAGKRIIKQSTFDNGFKMSPTTVAVGLDMILGYGNGYSIDPVTSVASYDSDHWIGIGL